MKLCFLSRPARRAGQLMLAMLLTSVGFAQMGGGGMMGGGGGGMMGDPTGGGMMGGGGFMGGGMMGGNSAWYGVSAVGPDGSAYMIRRAGGTSTQYMWGGQLNQKAELVAISPAGAARLLASIEGTTVSEPVTSPDGRMIYVTTSEPNSSWYPTTGTPFGNPSSPNRKPALVIIAPATGQTRTVNIDADYVSPPRVASEGSTGYVVYVVASQIGQQLGQTGSGTFLYGFSGDGTQRFRVQLTQ